MWYRLLMGCIAVIAVHWHGIYAGLAIFAIAALWDIAEAIRECKK